MIIRERSENKNARAKLANTCDNIIPEWFSKRLGVSRMPEASNVGIDIRVDSLIDSYLVKPSILAPDIVNPDLEAPGISANAWNKPIIKALLNCQSSIFLFSEKILSEINKSNPNISVDQPINSKDRNGDPVKIYFTKNPATITGNEATTNIRKN